MPDEVHDGLYNLLEQARECSQYYRTLIARMGLDPRIQLGSNTSDIATLNGYIEEADKWISLAARLERQLQIHNALIEIKKFDKETIEEENKVNGSFN